ncbi:MAG: ATP-binding protein [Sphaerochaeta sp.]
MMLDMMSNILRGGVSAFMNVILLFTLAKPRFGRRSTILIAILVFALDIFSAIQFYQIGDLTALSRFDVVMFVVLGFALKPLTRSSFMQWCFNFLTAINISMIIIILSYHLGNFFPAPRYAYTVFRFLLYVVVILLFKKVLLPLYKPIVNNWPVFLGLVVCIFLNFAYYFYVTDDIVGTLNTAMWPLFLLITLTLAAYGTVFFSLKKITAVYALETENLKIQNDTVLLSQAASTMAEKLHLMDEVVYQHSLASHDRRHFNSMLLGLLEQGEMEEAMTCLRKQNAVKQSISRSYCDNKAVNAVINYYVDMANQKGIQTKINSVIPMDVKIDSLELALVVSNLFENAIHGVLRLPEENEKYIHFSCLQVGRLLLEISNPCIDTVTLDQSGLPVTTQVGHGVGTKSITAFATKHNAELLYHVENGLFRVRLLI